MSENKNKNKIGRICCLILFLLLFLGGTYLLLTSAVGRDTPVRGLTDFLSQKGVLRDFGYSARALMLSSGVLLSLSLAALLLSCRLRWLPLLFIVAAVGLDAYAYFDLGALSPNLFLIWLAPAALLLLCGLGANGGKGGCASSPAVAEEGSACEPEPATVAESTTEPAAVAEPTTEPAAVATPEDTAQTPAGNAAEEKTEADLNEDTDRGRVNLGGREIEVSYRKSFLARLLLSEDTVKDYYVRIHNYLLSYTGKGRISWFYDSYNSGRTQLVKLAIRGKTLCVYFALPPAEYENTKYHLQEAGSKRYEKVPVMLRVRSERGVKYAKELVDAVMERHGVSFNEAKAGRVTVSDYPRDTLKNLIGLGLIKVFSAEGADLSGEDITLVPVAFTPRRNEAAGSPAPREAVEEEPLQEEITERGRVNLGGREVEVSYRKSFLARLLLSEDTVKDYYVRIHNHLLSYTGKNRISWFYDSYNSGRTQLVKLAIRGKTLCAYFALPPAEYENTKYHLQEAGSKRYEKVPAMLRVRSERGVKYAKELVDAVMAQNGLSYLPEKEGKAAVSDYPRDTLPNLIRRGLIKVFSAEGADLSGEDITLVPVAFTVRSSVTVHEAKQLLTDQDAMTLVVPAAPHEAAETEKELPYRGGRKFPINIDTLSAHFESGDTVTPAILRKKGLVPKKTAGVKILARGTLNKPLTVLAHDFSADAVKMIALTGGKAEKIASPADPAPKA